MRQELAGLGPSTLVDVVGEGVEEESPLESRVDVRGGRGGGRGDGGGHRLGQGK